MAATAEALHHAAEAAATALLFGSAVPAEPAVQHTLQRLFPEGTCYLAVAVCNPDFGDGSPLLLLSGNLLQSGSGQAAAATGLEPARAHTLRSSLVGAAMLAGRPQVFSLQSSSGGSSFAIYSDAAAAAERHGAANFLCLPFKAAQLAGAGTGGNEHSRGGKSGSLAAALLLGVPAKHAEPRRQQQPQPPVDGGNSAGGSSNSSSTQPFVQHMRSLLLLAAALAQHAQQELTQAAEALLVLRGVRPSEELSDDSASETDASDDEEGRETSGAADAEAGTATACAAGAAAADAAAAGAGRAAEPAHTCAQLASDTDAFSEAAACGLGSSTGTSSSSSALASHTPPLVFDTPAADPEAAAASAGLPAAPAAQEAWPAPAAAAAAAAGIERLPAEAAAQSVQEQAGAAASAGGQAGTGESAEAPEPAAVLEPAAIGARGAGGPLADLRARLRYLLLLCHAVLEQLMLLPSSQRGMHLDWLLRFQSVQPPGTPWQLGTHGNQPPAQAQQQQQQQQQERRQQGQGAPLVDRTPWQPHQQLGPSLEQQFLQYHSRLMANKMDAAGSLILLSILVLLSKEPSSSVRLGHPLFWLVSGVLTLPLAALLPGPPGAWYVAQREQVLVVFFTAALLYQQSTTNHLDLHVSQASQQRYVNAGFAWLTVDGLLLQMRFCRQLPTLVTCFLLNLKVIPEVCRRYHAHMHPQRCAASGFFRGVMLLLIPLVVLYLLELRMRCNWLVRRHLEAAEAQAEAATAVEAEAERLLRQHRLQERHALDRGPRRRHSTGATATGGTRAGDENSGASGSRPAGASG